MLCTRIFSVESIFRARDLISLFTTTLISCFIVCPSFRFDFALININNLNLNFNNLNSHLYFRDCIVSCESATTIGNSVYTIPSYAPIGTDMSMTCSTGYAWTTTPYPGASAHTATCTDVSGTGTWTLADSGSCMGGLHTVECRPYSNESIVIKLYFSLQVYAIKNTKHLTKMNLI